MTSLVAGRGSSQVTFLIHTSMVQHYQPLYKLCKPFTGTSSGQCNRDTALESISPSTQIILKDYDSQIASSLLSFLYTNDYWPEMPLLLKLANSMHLNHGLSQKLIRTRHLWTAHAITAHHFKLAILASKFSITSLLCMCRQKIDISLRNLPPRQLLELANSLYSKDYAYREQFFELISSIQASTEFRELRTELNNGAKKAHT